MRAKQRHDSVSERNGKLRCRFPEFVCAWFQPPASSLVNKPAQERDRIIAAADENRWGLYYGVKALSRELPECRLFYGFLDEKCVQRAWRVHVARPTHNVD